jgi:hypothetical protein
MKEISKRRVQKMKTVFRIIVLIVVLSGIVVLARNQVAWAANSSEKSAPSGLLRIEKSVSQDKGDYCDQPWHRRKPECKDKDKDKDKDKCKKHPNQCGSVKPPPWHIVINKSGEYSVGGFCTLSVTLNDPAIKLDVSIKTPLPGKLPDKVHKIRQGCLLTYYSSNRRIDELPATSGSTTICFAAIPAKQMTLYFYNLYSIQPKWAPLETTTKMGRACGKGNASGVYVATFQEH